MKITRYDCADYCDGGVMDEEPDGEFVKYSDYAALAEEREKLIAEVSSLRAQRHELAGVVADVEMGGGFDAICLKTIKRVIGVLGGAELRTCPKCDVKNLPAGTYCKGIACPLNPSHPSEAA